MTERLSEITAHIAGIGQLGAMVNAMRGVAGARAQQARGQLQAVETYASTIASAIGRALALLPDDDGPALARQHLGSVLILFCAEQGFAGAFSERVLDSIGPDLMASELFLVGTRGSVVAGERGIKTVWSSAMPSHSSGVPRLADRIAEALYERIAAGRIDRVEAVFARWQAGKGVHVERRRLFPLDMSVFVRPADSGRPVLNLPPSVVLTGLTIEYVHAQLCHAALNAFAAENEARMEAMAYARREIEQRLSDLRGRQRIVRQDEITAEIIELAAGEAASRR